MQDGWYKKRRTAMNSKLHVSCFVEALKLLCKTHQQCCPALENHIVNSSFIYFYFLFIFCFYCLVIFIFEYVLLISYPNPNTLSHS